ncbi:MAG: type II secretion system major pseudopilin GspG [Planctomycetaceae bacterium]|nr:type II secretion system major pseudopilin GspG [Planctomycetales bacterium]MCB9874911.1 type II secretion system major pseudopilin GspG [Planctomycetaceae bacterium]MCB9923765.1 type II secretion system major pseudopilin GspG [Planctomycetaceae bacterium]
MKRRRRGQRGFTLLEVLLVLTILVILGSTVGVFLSRTQTQAQKKVAKIQVDAIGQLMEQYHIDVGTFPTSQQGIDALFTAPADLGDTSKWAGPYSKKQIEPDPWSNPYQYESTGDSFRVWSWGPDGQDGTEDDITNS